MIHLVRILLLLLATTVVHAQEETTTIEVEITHIDNDEGQMLIGLYDSESNWLKKLYKGTFGVIEYGSSSAIFKDVPSGTYAISVFHDENNDGKLDTNFFGIPSEDTGSSNDAPAMFGPPKWEDAKFEVKGRTVKQVIQL
ncbi:DUF2141 domain-containing protein [Maribacter algarum]|uniref:DUF2141 domain-containing protein n=1 Tax=Maribacter algarum (ex Zhang et al. 2020) TaxID=2578118 RepID=A0A5S3PQ80_9FLAO|nr:DUF2141 domain-containing protein [Maribacter algarum]TMM56862.1 DUF2141 domain-containing protein [Maribacter algarum]